ncbi:hypothetical protein A4A49_39884 [Nicotiana attenuata]|uniref:Uncharacterized protein n=1 Tax=Nicotiana attenuata TaxID=49451 RepID=A0A1J6JTN9_NICAT|nr:hypothetical protein A4A49_39884 [Nicotiana attenuata]
MLCFFLKISNAAHLLFQFPSSLLVFSLPGQFILLDCTVIRKNWDIWSCFPFQLGVNSIPALSKGFTTFL